MFSFIVGQLYAFAPFLVDVHFALRQLHHDVRGLEAGVVGQIGTDAESAANFAAAVFLYVEGFAEVQGIAEYLNWSGTHRMYRCRTGRCPNLRRTRLPSSPKPCSWRVCNQTALHET